MDPTHRGPEVFGHDNDGYGEDTGRRRPRDPLSTEFGQQPQQQARVVQLFPGDFLLTVNPVDGSEVELCPPGEQPAAPVRRTPAERTDRERAAAPPVPPGPPSPQLPLLERAEERERLARLLGRGRSVRLTGPAGSGRTALLNAVAADCADLAPDGVVRLSGHKRTATDLLYGLYEAVLDAPLLRPDRAALLEQVRGIGAVVVLDDLEFGGTALEELLDATPECAFLLAATPDIAAPTADSHLEEVFLAGLGRSASVELLEQVVERSLTEDEANWAGDLWFESEGLPLRFVQAGALLRQRDMLRTDPTAYDEHGYFDGKPVDDSFDAFGQDADGHDVPLPSLGEGAAPAALLASRLSGPARDTLHFAVALGGEVPHQAHLLGARGRHPRRCRARRAGRLRTALPGGFPLSAGRRRPRPAGGRRIRRGRGRPGPYGGPALCLVVRAPLGHLCPRGGRGRRDHRGHDPAGPRRRGRTGQRSRAAGPQRRPRLRRRAALGRLGEGPAARPGGCQDRRRGRRRGLFPP